MFGTCVTMVVGHIPVKEILVVPSDDARVSPDPSEATLNVLGGDGVKSIVNVEKSDKAVGLGVNMTLNIINERGSRSLCGVVAPKAMLVWVKGTKSDILVQCHEQSRSRVLRR